MTAEEKTSRETAFRELLVGLKEIAQRITSLTDRYYDLGEVPCEFTKAIVEAAAALDDHIKDVLYQIEMLKDMECDTSSATAQ